MKRLGNLKTIIRRNRRNIALVLAWTVTVTLIVIKTHQMFYAGKVIQNPFSSYNVPTFTPVDLLLVFAVALLASVFLTEAKVVMFGYFTSMLLSSLLAGIYLFSYVWFVLGYSGELSTIPYGWEWGIALTIVNIFRYMIPMGITFSLMGAVTGSFIRMMAKP